MNPSVELIGSPQPSQPNETADQLLELFDRAPLDNIENVADACERWSGVDISLRDLGKVVRMKDGVPVPSFDGMLAIQHAERVRGKMQDCLKECARAAAVPDDDNVEALNTLSDARMMLESFLGSFTSFIEKGNYDARCTYKTRKAAFETYDLRDEYRQLGIDELLINIFIQRGISTEALKSYERLNMPIPQFVPFILRHVPPNVVRNFLSAFTYAERHGHGDMLLSNAISAELETAAEDADFMNFLILAIKSGIYKNCDSAPMWNPDKSPTLKLHYEEQIETRCHLPAQRRRDGPFATLWHCMKARTQDTFSPSAALAYAAQCRALGLDATQATVCHEKLLCTPDDLREDSTRSAGVFTPLDIYYIRAHGVNAHDLERMYALLPSDAIHSVPAFKKLMARMPTNGIERLSEIACIVPMSSLSDLEGAMDLITNRDVTPATLREYTLIGDASVQDIYAAIENGITAGQVRECADLASALQQSVFQTASMCHEHKCDADEALEIHVLLRALIERLPQERREEFESDLGLARLAHRFFYAASKLRRPDARQRFTTCLESGASAEYCLESSYTDGQQDDSAARVLQIRTSSGTLKVIDPNIAFVLRKRGAMPIIEWLQVNPTQDPVRILTHPLIFTHKKTLTPADVIAGLSSGLDAILVLDLIAMGADWKQFESYQGIQGDAAMLWRLNLFGVPAGYIRKRSVTTLDGRRYASDAAEISIWNDLKRAGVFPDASKRFLQKYNMSFPHRYEPSFLCAMMEGYKSPERAHKPTALILIAKGDWKAAFDRRTALDDELLFNYNVHIFEVAKKQDMLHAMRTLGENIAPSGKKIDMLVIVGHGSQSSIEFAEAPSPSATLRAHSIPWLASYKSYMSDDATIVLDSCSTGKGGESGKNVAAGLSLTLGTRVFAPNKPTALTRFVYDDRGRVVDVKYRDADAKEQIYIRPIVSSADQ